MKATRKHSSTPLETQARIAEADERLEEAVAALGGIEAFDGENGDVIDTIVRIGRVGCQKIAEAQRALRELNPEASHDPDSSVTLKAGTEPGAILTEDQVNRLEIILDQIWGCADLLISHLDLANDSGAMTCVNVIKEKSKTATTIVRAGFGPLPKGLASIRQSKRERAQ